jgi:polyvinyl alcohol dehydrogenase (cytochrome)
MKKLTRRPFNVIMCFMFVSAIAAFQNTKAEEMPSKQEAGAQLYADNCARCHESEGSRIPQLSSLQKMHSSFIQSALTEGKMAPQGYQLAIGELMTLVDWLTKDQAPAENWAEKSQCKDPSVNLATGPRLGGWGYGYKNRRQQSASKGGITSNNVGELKLKWSIAFPHVTQMRSQPALVGDTLFIAIADTSKVYALNADTGCVKWEYDTQTPPRTSLGYDDVDGRGAIWFGDAGGNVYMLDAKTGKEIWTRDIKLFKHSMVTGQPVLYQDILYIPLSIYETATAMNPLHECCTSHGAIVAVNALNGEPVWTLGTTPDAQKTQRSVIGIQQWGPAGAPVWNSPAIDEKRGVLYFGTGQNITDPATDTSDAIFAVDLKTGKPKWHFQATKNDTFNNACAAWYGGKSGPNCPKEEGRDSDFGAGVIIATLNEGLDNERDIVLAGQKSGTVWALDPDDNGKVLWKTSLSSGIPTNGGIHWGMAYDGKRLFVPISDSSPVPFDTPKPALHALDPATGDIIWTQNIKPPCTFDPAKAGADSAAGKPLDCHPYYGLSAPATVAGDVVFVGGLAGMYRAFDTATGKLLWETNTNISFDGINGIKGHGGAIDSNGSIISNGRVFIQSGYSMHRQLPGNMLLQFTVDGK